MKELVAGLEKLGLSDVRTYIQSGNVVFRSREAEPQELAGAIETSTLQSHGFRPRVLTMRLRELEKAAEANPFPEAEPQAKTLSLFFLAEVPSSPDFEALDAAKVDSERYVLLGKVFYLHTPKGYGQSKLARNAEKLIGVDCTARNWRSVSKIVEMANALS